MATEFTVEHINEVFESFNKAADEFLDALKFLSKMNIKPVETWLTVSQASERTGLPKRTIQGWAAKGNIHSRRISNGNIYEVLFEDVNKFASRRSAV